MVEGDVELTGPRDVIRQLTPRIRQHKAEILARLQADGTEAIAKLDRERNEADRQAGRGYDFDESAPSHAEFVEQQTEPTYERARAIAARCEHEREDLQTYLKTRAPELLEPEGLIAVCHRRGIGLSLDDNSTLIIETTGRAWASLRDALERHAASIATILRGEPNVPDHG